MPRLRTTGLSPLPFEEDGVSGLGERAPVAGRDVLVGEHSVRHRYRIDRSFRLLTVPSINQLRKARWYPVGAVSSRRYFSTR